MPNHRTQKKLIDKLKNLIRFNTQSRGQHDSRFGWLPATTGYRNFGLRVVTGYRTCRPLTQRAVEFEIALNLKDVMILMFPQIETWSESMLFCIRRTKTIKK